MLRHVIQGLRSLQKDAAFAIVTILTLALAIGANTTIFSVANGLLLKSQPGIGEPENLVDVGRSDRNSGLDNLSYLNYVDIRSHTEVFASLAASVGEPTSLSLRDAGPAESIQGSLVSADFFDVLQTKPARGRFFSPDDDKVGTAPAVVISDRLWAARFGKSPSIVGREIVLSGHGFTIIGVTPEQFHGSSVLATDLWIPMGTQPLVMSAGDILESRRANWLTAIGRLKPGVSMRQAQAAMSVVGAQLESAYPEANEHFGIVLAPHGGFPAQMATALTAFLAMLMAIVVIILAIACANVAGICLARITSRQREIAVRFALGAARAQVIRQLMTEMLVLFLVAGAAGSLLASWMTGLLMRFKNDLPVSVVFDVSPDVRVVVFTIGITFIAALLSSLAPALQATRTDVVTALKEEAAGTAYKRLRLRNALVVAQVAMSLLLLIGSGLFLRALSEAKSLDPGFDPNNVEVVGLDLFLAGYTTETGRLFDRDLVERISALPGVESAGLAVDLPLDGGNFGFGGIRIAERQPPAPYRYFSADWNLVSPGYLKTMKIPLLRGRDFSVRDVENAPHVAIINEAMAEELWPGEEAIGKLLYNGEIATSAPMEVIGVVKNIKDRSLGEEAASFIYAPLSQLYIPRRSVLIRTATGASVAPAVRSLLLEMNPDLPITRIQSMNDVTAFGLLPQRLAVWVAGSMGSVGLLLASLGIYGVTAYNVGRRTREIGIRVALGARRRSVMKLVLREGMKLTMIGLVLGCLAALGVTWLISSLLFGIAPTDAITFIATSAILTLVALLASYIPARRAVKIDPMVALRHQ